MALESPASGLSDLVRDSKLENTHVSIKFTAHTYQESNLGLQQRDTTRVEYWQPVRRIGSGAYGNVFLERCIKGQRGVGERAVKQIPRRGLHAEGIDYSRELEAIAKFSHDKYRRCFVQSFGWYEKDDLIYIAMEYLPHGDLLAHLNSAGSLSEEEAQRISFQICEGLHFLHQNRFTHRDLKPSNILIKQRPPDPWWVKIGDFGISKRAEDGVALVPSLRGTLGYMAPELLNLISSEATDLKGLQSTDMWALGEITHQMLTGVSCFKDIGALAKYAHGDDSLPISALQDKYTSILGVNFVSSLMKSEPIERLSSQQALHHAWLEKYDTAIPRQVSWPTEDSLVLADSAELPHNQSVNDPSGSWNTPAASLIMPASAESPLKMSGTTQALADAAPSIRSLTTSTGPKPLDIYPKNSGDEGFQLFDGTSVNKFSCDPRASNYNPFPTREERVDRYAMSRISPDAMAHPSFGSNASSWVDVTSAANSLVASSSGSTFGFVRVPSMQNKRVMSKTNAPQRTGSGKTEPPVVYPEAIMEFVEPCNNCKLTGSRCDPIHHDLICIGLLEDLDEKSRADPGIISFGGQYAFVRSNDKMTALKTS